MVRERLRLPIARPCPQVERLIGSGAQLHCAHCSQPVFDLSAMTELQARVFLYGFVGRAKPCIRYAQGSGGDIVFRRSTASVGGVAAALAAGAVAALIPVAAAAEPPDPAAVSERTYEGPRSAPPAADAESPPSCPLPDDGYVTGGVPPPDDRFYAPSSRSEERRLRREMRREMRRARRMERRAARTANRS